MTRTQQIIGTLILAFMATVGWAFPWNQDMVDQPTEKAHETQAPPGPGSIPVEGGETLPAPTTVVGMTEAKDAAASLDNPIAMSEQSIVLGKRLYEINCSTCHGVTGEGDGAVGLLFAVAPANLNDAYTQDQADGSIFFTLTRGRGAMPYYRDALNHEERWHVINYLRAEFGSE
ncbi:MAG: cytochrome C [Gammaproteobacteria bacterium]|nr:cytochrome C [Gammaproteobacteria bacterium]